MMKQRVLSDQPLARLEITLLCNPCLLAGLTDVMVVQVVHAQVDYCRSMDCSNSRLCSELTGCGRSEKKEEEEQKEDYPCCS